MSISNEVDEYSRNAQQLAAEVESAKKTLKRIAAGPFKDLSNLLSSTARSVENSTGEVADFQAGISGATRNTINAFGTANNGVIKTVAISAAGLIKIADMLVGGTFKHVQDVMNMQASVTGIGVTATVTTTRLVDLAESSGFPVTKALKITESFNAIGTSLTLLAPTTGKAVEKLFKVFDNREDQLKYLKRGIDPDTLIKYQAEGVKYLTGYGVKMGEDDRQLRKGTLAYVDTLTTLSILTGESRDQVAVRLAAMKSDVSYQIKMRELLKSGNTTAAAAFDTTLSLLDGVSPEIRKGMADFIANGQATTVEGKKMMAVMGNKAAQIAKDVEEGRMTGTEAAKAIATEYQGFAKRNEKNLSLSKEFQDATGMNGKVFMETERLAQISSEADAKKIVAETAKKEDKSVEAKNTMLNAEREIQMIKQQINQKTMPMALMVFKELIDITKATAFTFAKLAHGINGGKYDAALESIMMLTGSESDVMMMKRENEERVAGVKADMERLKNPDKRTAELAEKTKAAEAEFHRVSETRSSPAQIEAARKAMQNARDAQTKEAQEQARVRSSGVTMEQLQEQKYSLEQRGSVINRNYNAKTSALTASQWEERAEQKEADKQLLAQSVMNVDLTEANKYINFGSQSGDRAHWALLVEKNPGFAKNITLLAQEYFNGTGQQLSLVSAVRTYNEQKTLFEGWKKAGGDRKTNPTVNVPGHGNVSTPADPDAGETPHMRGVGVDISKAQLDWLEGRGILQRAGLRRPYRNDPVHIEKAKFGKSLIQGREIEMHGREALIELFNGTIPINLPPGFKENTFSEIRDTIKPKINKQDITPTVTKSDDSNELDLDLLNMIDSQFDDLIASMDKSNLLQHDIKTYMAA